MPKRKLTLKLDLSKNENKKLSNANKRFNENHDSLNDIPSKKSRISFDDNIKINEIEKNYEIEDFSKKRELSPFEIFEIISPENRLSESEEADLLLAEENKKSLAEFYKEQEAEQQNQKDIEATQKELSFVFI